MPDVIIPSKKAATVPADVPPALKAAYAAGLPLPPEDGVYSDTDRSKAEAVVVALQAKFDKAGPDERAQLEPALQFARGHFALYRRPGKVSIEA